MFAIDYYKIKLLFQTSHPMIALRRFLLFISIAIAINGCKSYSGEAEIHIIDDAGILSKEGISRIETSNPPYPIIVRTYSLLPTTGLNDFCDSVFRATTCEMNPGCQRFGVMVIADANNAVAKFGESFDTWNDCKGNYASISYLQVQIDRQITPENRILDVLNKAENSAINNNVLVGYVRGELFGFLYSFIKPSQSFFYRYIVHPFQVPFVFLANLFKSYYLASFVIIALLFVLSIYIPTKLLKSKKNIFSLRDGQHEINNKIISTVFGFFYTFLYLIPSCLGLISLAISLSLFGTEFIEQWSNYSFMNVTNLLGNASSESSILISALATIAFYISNTEDDFDMVNCLKTAIWGWIMFLSPLCISWAGFILYLPSSIYPFNAFWDKHYRDYRIHGLGKLESLFYTMLSPTLVLIGIYLGIYFGSKTGVVFHIDLL